MIASLNEVLADPLLKGKDPVIIDIDNVATYLDTNNMTLGDCFVIPHVVPPWDLALMVFPNHDRDAALLVKTTKVAKMWVLDIQAWEPMATRLLGIAGGFLPPMILALTDKGGVALTKNNEMPLLLQTQLNLTEEARQALFELVNPCIGSVLTACGFAHCKNVATVPVNLPRGLRRRVARVTSGQTLKSYTLNIKPMQKVLATQGQVGAVGIKQALHICRGHFKTYAEGKGLFGKLHGTYWWPQMVRGDQQHGVINKKYNVEAA
jgi:hypothetical protein